MEPVKYQRNAPSVQLLNEIDILLTQVRLAELYLKQAQATAADHVARTHERYESELETLRAGISQKERSLDESSARIAATEQIHLQIQDLQAERGKLRDEIAQKALELQQHRSAARESEQLLQVQLRRLQDELALEQARVFAKESDLEHARAAFQARLQESAALLEETKRQLEERRAGFAKVERDLQERLDESDRQQRRKQASLDERESELQNSRANLAALQGRIADLETDIAQAAAFKHETQRAHAALVSDIAALRTDLDKRDRLLAEGQSELAASRQNLAQQESSQRLAEEAANSRLGTARSNHEAELAQLRATLADREHAFAERERGVKISVERHTAEIAGLRAQLAEGQSSLEQRTGELQEARSEIAALRIRAEQLDLLQKQTERLLAVQAEQIRQRVRAEFEDLDTRLASKDRELEAVRESAAEALTEQQAKSNGLEERMTAQVQDFQNRLADQRQLLESREDVLARAQEEFDNRLRQKDDVLLALQAQATELQDSLNSKISELQTQLLEKQRRIENTTGEIADLKASVSGLSEQTAQLASVARDAQSQGAAEVERVKLEYQAELLDLREELRGKHDALAEKEARATELERRLGTHISDLETELAARQRLLEQREEALNTVNSSAVALQERLTRLGASSRDAQGARAKDADLMRATLEAELADLRSELQQKEWAIAQRQALIDNLGQGHNDRIRTLETKLAELRHVAENRATELGRATSERQRLLSRIDQLESAAADTEATAISRVEQITLRYEAQMASLQIEIEQKRASVLAEQTGAEDRERLHAEYEAQLATLREELSQAERSDKDQGAMETAQITTGQTVHSRSDRRWRSSGGWKRRWKT